MMRKILNVGLLVGFLLAMAGIASADVVFDSGVVLLNNQTIASGTTGDIAIATSGFSVPFDSVTSAFLDIIATSSVGTNKNILTIDVGGSSTLLGYLANGGMNQPVDTNLPFSDAALAVFASWAGGQTLTVHVNNTSPQDLVLSTYLLHLEGVGDCVAPVPEPNAMMLLGSGLIGLLGLNRRFNWV